jgi:hypothetical protein
LIEAERDEVDEQRGRKEPYSQIAVMQFRPDLSERLGLRVGLIRKRFFLPLLKHALCSC